MVELILDKLWFLIPEMILFGGAVVVSVVGLAGQKRLRESVPLVTCLILAAAFVVTPLLYTEERLDRVTLLMPTVGMYVKMLVCVIGVALAMLSVGLIDRKLEDAVASGRTTFNALRANRGEYFAFFLLSLSGVMLCCNANDLIWLFLALELTSLPTYIMVAMSRGRRAAQEAAVKYFFLGALAAGIFLYGFALLYGATGTIVLTEMRDVLVAEREALGGQLPLVATVGLILALLGVSFKIVAAPMHFYAADVYEGAASPVTAFLAFVPKTAGMVAMMLLLSIIGWGGGTWSYDGLPGPILITLWMISVLTMTLGNVGALLQTSAKRLLAYSSIAHSGYMIMGLIAGPGLGLNAVLFYLLAYGVMNTTAFAVLAGLERRGFEIESLEDLAGLRHRHALMAIVMAVAAGSLIGVPPLLGFVGKLYLFIAAVDADRVELVVIAGINSAISAFYYLRLVGLPILARPTARSETIVAGPTIWPRLAAVLTAVGVVVIPIFAGPLVERTREAAQTPAVRDVRAADAHADAHTDGGQPAAAKLE